MLTKNKLEVFISKCIDWFTDLHASQVVLALKTLRPLVHEMGSPQWIKNQDTYWRRTRQCTEFLSRAANYLDREGKLTSDRRRKDIIYRSNVALRKVQIFTFRLFDEYTDKYNHLGPEERKYEKKYGNNGWWFKFTWGKDKA